MLCSWKLTFMDFVNWIFLSPAVENSQWKTLEGNWKVEREYVVKLDIFSQIYYRVGHSLALTVFPDNAQSTYSGPAPAQQPSASRFWCSCPPLPFKSRSGNRSHFLLALECYASIFSICFFFPSIIGTHQCDIGGQEYIRKWNARDRPMSLATQI